MAKMFYTIDEAAEKLGKSPEEVQRMASEGKLQQFRDRDNVMFKVDQIDKMAGGGTGAPVKDDDPGATDTIDLADSVGDDHDQPKKEDTRGATGISVFDADEVDAADPLAQTVVSDSPISDDDELALESVGSGSGLLDLTRESDDTSLGAELLEEIYPSSGSAEAAEGQGSGMQDIFESTGADSGPSAIGEMEGPAAEPAAPPAVVVEAEPGERAGSGWTAGLLLGALAAIGLGMMLIVSTMVGAQIPLLQKFAEDAPLYSGALLAASLVLAVIGGVIGKLIGR